MIGGVAAKEVPTVIGQAFGGGYYVGKISTTGNNVETHYLIVAPISSGQTTAQAKTTDTATTGTSSLIDGPTNSANMNNATHPASNFCEGLTIGGYDDWYMPSIAELEICYYNLKPTTDANALTSPAVSGTYAIPQRTVPAYTSATNPSQTSVTIFKSGGAEAFNGGTINVGEYWSSTQGSSTDAMWRIWFYNGNQNQRLKTQNYKVRAVRRIPV